MVIREIRHRVTSSYLPFPNYYFPDGPMRRCCVGAEAVRAFFDLIRCPLKVGR